MMNENSSHQQQMLIKKLRFRAWHRGTKEMDLILGPFADACLADMKPQDVSTFQALLQISDIELLKWFTGASQPPSEWDVPIVSAIREFALKNTESRT